MARRRLSVLHRWAERSRPDRAKRPVPSAGHAGAEPASDDPRAAAGRVADVPAPVEPDPSDEAIAARLRWLPPALRDRAPGGVDAARRAVGAAADGAGDGAGRDGGDARRWLID
jgi:hypothetical protein